MGIMSNFLNNRLGRRQFIQHTGRWGALGLVAAARPAFGIATSLTPTVPTTDGPIRGLVDEGVHTFLGVPYAAPPVGKLRFMPPVPAIPRKRLLDTVMPGRAAMQLSSGASAVTYPGTIGPALSQLFGSRRDLMTQGEDCLVLNIWSPALVGEKRPVMVWFHGGGFNYGSGNWPAYDGHNLALNHDVVVVTVNHRLNGFGFLNLAELGGERYRDSGIAGQLDLVRSLEWIRDNIENFGGDPGNVTIFGQSGGGAKVSTLHGMPTASGLFHKCIIQSGAGLTVGDPAAATEVALKVMLEAGVGRGEVEKLQQVDTARLQAAIRRVGGRYGPILNMEHIPAHPFGPGSRAYGENIPVMVGFTKDEATLYNVGFEWWRDMTEEQLRQRIREQRGGNTDRWIDAYRKLHPSYAPRHLYTAILTSRQFFAASTLAEVKAGQNSGDAYLYSFNWDAPVDDGILKAPHTIEIPFVFDNVDKGPLLLGTDRRTRRLGTEMSKVWTRFARTGNPDTSDIPRWAPYDTKRRTAMVFDNVSRAVKNYMDDVWLLLGLRE
jgi:para-nitrobenzyl esterase